MSLYERLLVPGSTELPECRCGEDMKAAGVDDLPDQSDTQIRIYKCPACHHEMRLTVWADDQLARVALNISPRHNTLKSRSLWGASGLFFLSSRGARF